MTTRGAARTGGADGTAEEAVPPARASVPEAGTAGAAGASGTVGIAATAAVDHSPRLGARTGTPPAVARTAPPSTGTRTAAAGTATSTGTGTGTATPVTAPGPDTAAAAEERRSSGGFLARAALVTAVLSVAGSVLGLVRDQALARLFGAGGETDAFLVAWTVPEFAATLLIEDGLAFALVPMFSLALARRSRGAPGRTQGPRAGRLDAAPAAPGLRRRRCAGRRGGSGAGQDPGTGAARPGSRGGLHPAHRHLRRQLRARRVLQRRAAGAPPVPGTGGDLRRLQHRHHHGDVRAGRAVGGALGGGRGRGGRCPDGGGATAVAARATAPPGRWRAPAGAPGTATRVPSPSPCSPPSCCSPCAASPRCSSSASSPRGSPPAPSRT
ncbi:putative peptidoglycan lipid II flippase MurJ [Streptomyces lividans 1326]|uniref:Putative peptidoglycan lipid II flippase MurJ n=1 Tax=Streptomyces lividans 1326 TaxID=1200984 RepID=A0A7U9DPI5_STRLI|nr:putative peptidoglycan lipid II flippase MurJ [Streptomyces lividans 1326]